MTRSERAAVCFGSIVLLAGCGGARREEPQPKAQAQQTWIAGPEDVVRASTGSIVTGPIISGELRADDAATVRAQLAGQIVEVNAKVGDRVRKGQALARIRAFSEREAVASAKAAVETARTELAIAERDEQRTDALVEAGALAQRDLEQARAAVANARARVAQAQAGLAAAAEQLRESVARAPIAGSISSLPIGNGDVVGVGAELFTILDLSTLELEATAPSDNVGDVRAGAPVRFRVQGLGDTEFTGRILRVSPSVDPNTNQIRVYVTVPNTAGRLVAGLYAEGRLATGRRDAIILPADAVAMDGDRAYVTVVEGGKAVRREVEIGHRDEQTGAVEIAGGIGAGALVLTGAAREVREGAAVEVRGSPQESAADAVADAGPAAGERD